MGLKISWYSSDIPSANPGIHLLPEPVLHTLCAHVGLLLNLLDLWSSSEADRGMRHFSFPI